MAAVKKLLRYLQSRNKVPLKWCALDNVLPGIIHSYADASFADIPDTRLSSIRYDRTNNLHTVTALIARRRDILFTIL
jgi:hypothetical protein